MKRVVFVMYPYFLEPGLHLVQELSRRVELHVFMEVGVQSWNSSAFAIPPLELRAGVIDADPVLTKHFPPAVQAYWAEVASFKLIVHSHARTLDWRSVVISREACGAISRLKPDVVHIDGLGLRLALGLSSLRPYPLVVSFHDPEPRKGESDWRHSLARYVGARRARRIVLFNQAAVARWAQRYGRPEAVSYIPLGPYYVLRAWAGGSRDTERSGVLAFGRLSPYKGLDVLIRASREVARRVPNLIVTIAGNPVPGYLPPQNEFLPNGGALTVVPRHIGAAELGRMFRAASVIVCPYLDASQSGVVLTAYAFERPVIASEVGGLGDYVIPDHTGLLVGPGDAPALARALTEILTDHPKQARLAAGAKAIGRETLSWAVTADKIMALYADVTDGAD